VEWVQTTGKTVEDAVNQALDELGVASEDAEVEVLEEPRQGLFGRVRGAARVRARVRPTAPRPKQERRRRGGRKDRESDGANEKAGGGESARKEPRDRSTSGRSSARGAKANQGNDDSNSVGEGQSRRDAEPAGRRSAAPSSRGEDKEREMMPEAEQREAGEVFLSGLLETMELEGSVTSSLDEEGILRFDVTGSGLGLLIGPGLVTLDAVQEICRNAIQRQAAGREYGKVELDVAEARAERKRALEEFTRGEATRVLDTGDEVIFDVMSRGDRKIVHDVISEFDGLQTESVGEDPRRRVILRRA
jgi:spoIIIJ-associated protein